MFCNTVEFLGCCVFLFVKHPYDVGDCVDINKEPLLVEHVSLMYSVFRNVHTSKQVQIPHNVANALFIENVSRSPATKERFSVTVAPTTTDEEISKLRDEIMKYITTEENKRDFKPHVEMGLGELGDLQSLQLKVEVKYKVRYWKTLVDSHCM